MTSRQLLVTLAGIAIIAISFAVMDVLASMKEEPKMKPPPEVRKYVDVQPVAYSDVKTEIMAYGRVRTAQSLDLLSEVAGRMHQGNIRLKEGERFKKGSLLFYIDDREAALTLKSQKSTFLRDLAAILPDFKIDFSASYDTWQAYFSKLDIDKDFPELPEAKSDKEKTFLATKGIYSSFYTIKSAEERLKKHRYYAPFDGSIAEVVMESGGFVNPGTRIGRIIRTGDLELMVSVDTRDVPWIIQGSEVRIFSDETQQAWRGRITRISDLVNANTQSVDVYLALNAGGPKIYDGQFLRAAMPSRTVKDAMLIPRNVIYNGNEVFVLEDSLLKKHTVIVYKTTEEIAVVNGLQEGSLLVVEPLINAHNNMRAFRRESKDIDMEGKGAQEKKVSSQPLNEEKKSIAN
jgi:membrane fusion protein, multidrug efflux system